MEPVPGGLYILINAPMWMTFNPGANVQPWRRPSTLGDHQPWMIFTCASDCNSSDGFRSFRVRLERSACEELVGTDFIEPVMINGTV